MIGYEYLFLRWVGTTPGKLIFNLKVFDHDENPIKKSDVYSRTRGLLKSGLGYMFWFPWFQILLAFYTHNHIKKNGATKWDLGRFVVKQQPISLFRFISGALVAFILLTLSIGFTQFAKQIAKKQNYDATIPLPKN
jgi:hypothetical protein